MTISHSRPLDRFGNPISAFDIIRLIKLPDYIMADADTPELEKIYRDYEGCYGIVRYFERPDQDGWRRYTSANGVILIKLTKLVDDFFTSYEFVVPADCVEVLPYNILIMNLLVSVDWQIAWSPLDEFNSEVDFLYQPSEEVINPVRSGNPLYAWLKAIASLSYEELVMHHNKLVSGTSLDKA